MGTQREKKKKRERRASSRERRGPRLLPQRPPRGVPSSRLLLLLILMGGCFVSRTREGEEEESHGRSFLEVAAEPSTDRPKSAEKQTEVTKAEREEEEEARR